MKTMARYQFDGPIFFGSQFCYEGIYQVHRLVEEACSNLGGLQQPDHPTNEQEAKDSERSYKIGNSYQDDIIKNIVIALGGKHLLKTDKQLKFSIKENTK